MDKTKRGIALFITLLVIASILSIVAVSFSYLEKVQKDAGKISALIQGNLLYKNTTEILKRFFPKGKVDNKRLEMLYSLPLMLSEPKSGFNINLQCKPLLIGVPIKWLDETFTEKFPARLELAQKVLTEVMNLYEIEEPNRLEELIISEVRGKKDSNSEYEPRLRQKAGVVSKKQFDRIIVDYRLKYDDTNVFNVPWNRYFSFIDVSRKAVIDGAYVSSELISLAFEIPLESVKDDWQKEKSIEEDKQTLSEFLSQNLSGEPIDNTLFSPNALSIMHCEQSYLYQEKYYRFSFDYTDERSVNFEFNGEI